MYSVTVGDSNRLYADYDYLLWNSYWIKLIKDDGSGLHNCNDRCKYALHIKNKCLTRQRIFAMDGFEGYQIYVV